MAVRSIGCGAPTTQHWTLPTRRSPLKGCVGVMLPGRDFSCLNIGRKAEPLQLLSARRLHRMPGHISRYPTRQGEIRHVAVASRSERPHKCHRSSCGEHQAGLLTFAAWLNWAVAEAFEPFEDVAGSPASPEPATRQNVVAIRIVIGFMHILPPGVQVGHGP